MSTTPNNRFAVISPFSASPCAWFQTSSAASAFATERNEAEHSKITESLAEFERICAAVKVAIGPLNRACFRYFVAENAAE